MSLYIITGDVITRVILYRFMLMSTVCNTVTNAHRINNKDVNVYMIPTMPVDQLSTQDNLVYIICHC